MDDNRSDDEGKRSNSDPFEWLNLIVSEPYFLFHFLVFFSYIPIRFSASQFLSPQFSLHLFHREIQAVLACSVLTLIKVVKEETWEAFAADTIFFAKIFLVTISLVMDYHLAIWYTLIFFVTYNVAQQPPFQGLGMVNQLTPLQLEALLTDGNSSKFCLVEFRSLSSSTCIRSSRIGPELSITFSNKLLSFGVVDLGVFPNTAEKFGISSGIMKQLPTYILFENAEEVTRFPEVDFDLKGLTPTVTKKALCRHFEIDGLFLEYVTGK